MEESRASRYKQLVLGEVPEQKQGRLNRFDGLVHGIAGVAMVPALLGVLYTLYQLGEDAQTSREIIVAVYVVTVFCLVSAIYFVGRHWTLLFFGLAVIIGWTAEQIGVKSKLIFGDYVYTDLLGPRLGEVPFVIPLMWFNLTFLGYILVNLMIDHYPIDRSRRVRHTFFLSIAAAFVVTAYNLPNDPYMVAINAWKVKGTGAYFGIDYRAFIGWPISAFLIVFLFRLTVIKSRPFLPKAPGPPRRHWFWSTLPIVAYAVFALYFTIYGKPVETRIVAPLAMGIPVLGAFAGWLKWNARELRSSHWYYGGTDPEARTDRESSS